MTKLCMFTEGSKLKSSPVTGDVTVSVETDKDKLTVDILMDQYSVFGLLIILWSLSGQVYSNSHKFQNWDQICALSFLKDLKKPLHKSK